MGGGGGGATRPSNILRSSPRGFSRKSTIKYENTLQYIKLLLLQGRTYIVTHLILLCVRLNHRTRHVPAEPQFKKKYIFYRNFRC